MREDHDADDPVDGVCAALAHPARRKLLRTLRRTETRTVEALARDLADGEWRSNGDERTRETDRIAVALHHHHLPKMAAADVIDYDPETRTISTTDDVDLAYDLLDVASDGSES